MDKEVSAREDIRLYNHPIASGVEATVKASHIRFDCEHMQSTLNHFCDVSVEAALRDRLSGLAAVSVAMKNSRCLMTTE